MQPASVIGLLIMTRSEDSAQLDIGEQQATLCFDGRAFYFFLLQQKTSAAAVTAPGGSTPVVLLLAMSSAVMNLILGALLQRDVAQIAHGY